MACEHKKCSPLATTHALKTLTALSIGPCDRQLQIPAPLLEFKAYFSVQLMLICAVEN